MRSHFRMNGGAAAVACGVAGAATMLNGHCAAQAYVAADYATNSIYNGGWSAGQNGGNGFGAWSFNDSDPGTTPGILQEITTTSAVGTAWTLMNTVYTNGISNVGRSILEPGGLQVGQTFQAIIQNPVNNAGIYTYRGFDFLFTSRTTNNPAGDNFAALRVQVFDYFDPGMHWKISDGVYFGGVGSYNTGVSAITTGESGMIVSLTLNSTNTYTFTMAPVSDPNSPYATFSSTLQSDLPIRYVNFREYNTASTGPTDTPDNFEIASMSIIGTLPLNPQLNIQPAGANVVLSWSTNVPAPTVVGNQNFVTNPISGPQQFYRLQLVQ
jgi:hypothetical protein